MSKEAMRSALKAGATIHAGNGGYSLGTREKYDAFVKVRNESLNLEQAERAAWVGLTLEDKKEYLSQDFGGSRADAMDWADKRLKEKNT